VRICLCRLAHQAQETEMKIIRWLINVVCAITISMVFLYFSISMAILAFIVMGGLTPGQPMYFDANTPTLWQVLGFQLTCMAIMASCFFLRAKIGQKNDFKFLKKN
jgi:hypothetical protein